MSVDRFQVLKRTEVIGKDRYGVLDRATGHIKWGLTSWEARQAAGMLNGGWR